jgi:tRNA pseudouridine55 synthase
LSKRRSHDRDVRGVLVLDKRPGISSHGLVQRVRRSYRTSRVGHTGTLDPLASGVMVLLLGSATRAAEYIQEDDKEYLATLLLGRETDTCDVTGETRTEADPAVVHGITREELERAAACFLGEITQVPPAFCAVKVAGRPLYRLARRGEEVSPPPRRVTIRALAVDSFAPPHAVLRVSCSKGTYMRTLCHDLGRALGVGGCMEGLRRLRNGRFTLADAVTLEAAMAASDPDAFLRPTAEALPFPRHRPTPGEWELLSRGQSIPWTIPGHPPAGGGGRVAVVEGDLLLALGEVVEGRDGPELAPRKILEPGGKKLCKIEE